MFSSFEGYGPMPVYHHHQARPVFTNYASNGGGYGWNVGPVGGYYDPTKPAFDMETLKAGVRCATTGTGEVKTFIQKCTFRPREQAFTTLINMCGRLRDWMKALEVFEAMKDVKNVRPNTYTYSALISACSCAGEWQRALSVFDAMKVAAESDPGCRPNHVTFCALVTACERCGQHKVALDLFDEMTRAEIAPDRVTWIAALSAADKLEKWNRVEQLLGEMHERGIAGTLAVYCGLIDHYAVVSEWQKALDNFLIMQNLGLAVDEHACKALMSALSAGRQCKMCLQLLDSMDESHLNIDLPTYNLALSALAENGCWQEARDVLSTIVTVGLKPNEESVKYAITACEAAGQNEEAEDIRERYCTVLSTNCLIETNSSSDDTNYDAAETETRD